MGHALKRKPGSQLPQGLSFHRGANGKKKENFICILTKVTLLWFSHDYSHTFSGGYIKALHILINECLPKAISNVFFYRASASTTLFHFPIIPSRIPQEFFFFYLHSRCCWWVHNKASNRDNDCIAGMCLFSEVKSQAPLQRAYVYSHKSLYLPVVG